MSLNLPITGLSHIGLRVHALDRSRAFYERLGFRFVAGPIGPEPVAIMSHPSGVEINFILNASAGDCENVLMDVAEKHAGYTHIALAVDNVQEVMMTLENAGIAISGGPISFPGGASAIFIRDPDRNVIEFNQKA